MEFRGRNLVFLLIATALIVSLSEAHKYHVGGKEGWIVKPHLRYNHWSDRTRFIINDSLVFKYNKGGDSVLLVTKEGYYNCDTKSPVERWEDGASEVALNRSGPFFFISGVEEHCKKGQRVIVVVLPWGPQPPIHHPPHAGPSCAPAPTLAITPVPHPSPSKAPSPKPADHPTASPPSHQPTLSPSPSSSDTPTIGAPAPAPEGSSASSLHAPLVVAAVTVLLSAIL